MSLIEIIKMTAYILCLPVCAHSLSPLLISEFDPTVRGLEPLEFVEIYNFSTTETVDLAAQNVHIVRYNIISNRTFGTPIPLEGTVGPDEYFVIGGSDVSNLDQSITGLDTFINQQGGLALYEGLNPDDLPNDVPSSLVPEGAEILDALVYQSRLAGGNDLDDSLQVKGLPYELRISESYDLSIQRDFNQLAPSENARRDWSSSSINTPSPGIANDLSETLSVIHYSVLIERTQLSNVNIFDQLIVTSSPGQIQRSSNSSPAFIYVEFPESTIAINFNSNDLIEVGNQYFEVTGDYSSESIPLFNASSFSRIPDNSTPQSINYFDLLPLEIKDELRLVHLENVLILSEATTFEALVNYGLRLNGEAVNADFKVGLNHGLIGQTIPKDTVSITGILFFEDGENVIYPRTVEDLELKNNSISDKWFIQ